MPDALPREADHRRPHPPALDGPFLEFDLTREIKQLHDEADWKAGKNARTLVKYQDFRVVLTVLRATMRMPAHKTEVRLSIHVLSGHVRMNALGRTFDLVAGSLLALDQSTLHDVEALDDSALLLTIAWPGRGERRLEKT